jgi:hypothetical protein
MSKYKRGGLADGYLPDVVLESYIPSRQDKPGKGGDLMGRLA